MLGEILEDVAKPRPMTRLLQGEVGSGKTAVAAAALFVAVQNGAQGSLMAPTEILSEQHYRSLTAFYERAADALAAVGARTPRVGLLTGSTRAAERRRIYQAIADGEIDVLVGTQAVIQDTVELKNLGLAVVDEQHRFGVRQRVALREKGGHPHLLVMTATPIPRTLALSIYGDLDLSLIDELPPGRQKIKTFLLDPEERNLAYEKIRREAAKGGQAFVICPLVEDSPNLEARAATAEYERLQAGDLAGLRLALLHGRMRPAEKDRVMREFRDGEHDVLVSTAVVEVGVDIPNASVMLIEGAERFGLAQLHQFRGRVGRGSRPSVCLLLTEEASERRHRAPPGDGRLRQRPGARRARPEAARPRRLLRGAPERVPGASGGDAGRRQPGGARPQGRRDGAGDGPHAGSPAARRPGAPRGAVPAPGRRAELTGRVQSGRHQHRDRPDSESAGQTSDRIGSARYTKATMVPLELVGQLRRPVPRLPGWRPGIRARLFLLALVTLSPLVGVLIFQDYYHLVAARQRADADATRLAQMKAGDVDQNLLAIETQLAALRTVIAADRAQISANEAALTLLLNDLPAAIDGIAAFAVDGGALGAAWRDDVAAQIPVGALEDQIVDTEARRRLVVGQPLQVAPGRPSTVLASRALADQAGAQIVVVLALRPDRMPPLTDIRGLPRGSTVSIVDVRGALLARMTSSEASAGGVLVSSTAVQAPARTDLVRRSPAATDDRVIGYAVADRAPWVVYVDAPAEVALISARTDFVRDLVIGSVMLALALLLAWLIAERITAPIRQLTTDAVALGAGHLARRTTVRAGGEIGVLAGAFNETAGAIEQLVGSLRTTQSELRSLNLHLEQRVRDRTAQLAALNSELEAFSFSVSHDLRAPLRRMDQFSVALLEDYGDRIDADGKLMLERLSVGCEQMSALIDDLLRLSHVSRAELLYRRVDLGALAAEVVAELRQANPDHPVAVSIADDLTVHGDASLLRVVLQNLLSNAWKFTRGQPEPRVEFGAVTLDGAPAFYVCDNGVGFDQTKADKLFRAFQRLHDARDFEGTGVGLATVQRIVHRHGGRVWAQSNPGRGATFWFTVPDWLGEE